ncbi:hypothetical protein L218DRAFT_426068 [Marasmius fiardii PR-910]|nr:hypothetical protein L218DRAFT_426068 [Marasmius fiardii PR-910]
MTFFLLTVLPLVSPQLRYVLQMPPFFTTAGSLHRFRKRPLRWLFFLENWMMERRRRRRMTGAKFLAMREPIVGLVPFHVTGIWIPATQ